MDGRDRHAQFRKKAARRFEKKYQAQTQGVPVFMKEDLLPIMGEERMIQELPEQFTKCLQ